MEYIVIDKKTETASFYTDQEEMARDSEEQLSDILWQIKRTGRFDSADGEIVIIESWPPKEA